MPSRCDRFLSPRYQPRTFFASPIWQAKPETASRLRGRIEAVLDAARVGGHIDDRAPNPARWAGHLEMLLPRAAKLSRGHHAAMAFADVPAFIGKLRQAGQNSMAALALEFAILTAARTGEVLGARWSENRLWLLNAFAIALLTLLGAAGEALGYDRYLKSNTTKRRTHSLFRQGCMLYALIPTMPEVRLLPLIERFATMLAELPVFADAFGVI